MPMPLSAKVNISRVRLRGAASAADGERDRSLVGEFHRVIGEIFQRGAQAQGIGRTPEAGRSARDLNLRLDGLVAGTGSQRDANGLSQRARRKRFVPQHEAFGIGLGCIDDQRGKRRQMVGAAFDCIRPFALTRAQIRRRKQLGQGNDPGQRRANIVRDSCERGFDGARIGGRLRATTRAAA